MAATLGKPPVRAGLGAPPAPEDARDNIKPLTKETQFNVRLDPAKHAEIKIAAIKEGKSLAEYLLLVHDTYQSGKSKGA